MPPTGDDLYQRARPLLELAARELRERLNEMLASVDNRHLVRARVTEFRTKELKSLKRKARRKNWSMSEALAKAPDLVGCRIACNNLQDAERAADLLEQTLRKRGIPVKREDHIQNPKPGGYRAIHLDLRLRVQFGTDSAEVGCEVQLRSLLQDAWGHLTHADVYKEKQPERLRNKARHLSELLALADKVADEIRTEVAKPRAGRKPAKGAPLSGSSVAFLFKRAFDIEARDYVVESCLRELEDAAVRPDGLDNALRDEKLRARLVEAYKESARWEPEASDIFRWVVRTVSEGKEPGLELARADGREAWAEVDSFGRSEMRGTLPETWEEFVAEMSGSGKDDDPTSHILTVAEGYGATTVCTCGTTIVQADSLAESVVGEFGLEDEEAMRAYEAIEQAVVHSGVETGGFSSSRMCSSCSSAMSRD